MHALSSYIRNSITNALNEDIGNGDVTAKLIPEADVSHASVITRQSATICGVDWFNEVFTQLDPRVEIDWYIKDGEIATVGQRLCTLYGLTRGLLTGERCALNFLQTLSATATQASKYAMAVLNTPVKILDTRKTIPGLRIAQKYAVKCGGCHNHRVGLYDAILIKENHIHACGGISQAINTARRLNPDLMIEIEVESLNELQLAIDSKVDRIMLDNFELEMLYKAVKMNQQKAELEVSGNVTLENIKSIADSGVDYISVGDLTKNIMAVDLSMRFT